MFVTGPDVVKTVTHEEVSFEELGGALTHASTSGVAHFAADGEEDAIFLVQKLLSYLPCEQHGRPARRPLARTIPLRTDEALDALMPDEPNKPYDMREVITKVVDDGEFLEIMQNWAGNILIGFARLGGRSGGHRREPAGGAGRRARHQRQRQGGPLRPLLRLRSTSRSSPSWMCPASCPAPRRSTAASSATAPS